MSVTFEDIFDTIPSSQQVVLYLHPNHAKSVHTTGFVFAKKPCFFWALQSKGVTPCTIHIQTKQETTDHVTYHDENL